MKTPVSSPSCLAQLNILSGEQPPHCLQPGNFPARIGRGKDCQVQLTGEGIWEQHLELRLEEDQFFSIRPASEATAMVNGEPLEEVRTLRNGDVIEIGMVKLQFLLGPIQQKKLGLREAATWLMVGLIIAGEIFLLLWLD